MSASNWHDGGSRKSSRRGSRMPTTEIGKKIATAKRYTKLVECYRGTIEENEICDLGYVVDANDKYVLLQLVDDRITLNGYSLLHISDITNVELEVEHARFIERALDIRKKVGQNVRRLRDEKDWTQEDLAHETGLHRTYISGIERGVRNPTVEVLEKIAIELDISPGRLLDEPT